MKRLLCLAANLVGVLLPAQDPQVPTDPSIATTAARVDVERLERELAEADRKLRRLEQLAVRNALGLPVRADRYFRPGVEDDTLARSGADLSALHSAILGESAAAAAELARIEERIDAVGRADSGASGSGVSATPEAADPDEVGSPAVLSDLAFEPSSATEPKLRDDAETPSALRGDDVALVSPSAAMDLKARLLLRSGELQLRRAAELERNEDPSAAAELRQRALDGFAEARLALEERLGAERADAPLEELFLLGRCEEELGHVQEAEAIYLDIMARDRVNDRDGAGRRYGEWGTAASTARRVGRWLADTGDWQPAHDIDAIRWQKN